MLFFSNQYYLSSKRYIETGYCEGFFPTAMEYVKKHYNVRDVNILPWKVYTGKDIEMQHAKVSSKRTTGIYPYTFFNPTLFQPKLLSILPKNRKQHTV